MALPSVWWMLAIALLGMLGVYAFMIEPRWLRLRRYCISTDKWPVDARPLRIAYASDFHTGCPSVGLETTARIVERLNDLKADIILLGGDFLIKGVLFGRYVPPHDIAAVLSKLNAPLGVFTVLGNHDWRKDGRGMRDGFEKAGIRVLENMAMPVNHDGYNFWVAGLDDDTEAHPDFAKTVSFVTDGNPVIMLAHDPVSFRDVDARPVLTLSGHTHGGQIVIPFLPPLIMPGRAPRKYAYGHIRENGRDLIVSAGIGTSILPLRIGARPEIVLIELQHRAGGSAV